MAGSTFGNIFKITTWGESHGRGVGVVIDGCPAGLALCEADILTARVFDDRVVEGAHFNFDVHNLTGAGLDKTGVGLGLYIAKTIIDAHEEEIWVKSVYGENCEFVFTLPYTPEAEITVKD